MLCHRADRVSVGHAVAAATSLALSLGDSAAWWPLYAFLAVHLVAVQHNHAHAPVFRWGWANRLFDVWTTTLCGLPMFAWRTHHLARHHVAPWSSDDWSSPYPSVADAAADRPMSLLSYQLRYGPLFWCASLRWIAGPEGRRHRARCIGELLGVSGCALAAVWFVGPWRSALAVLPVWCACGIALGAVNYYQHWRARFASGEVAAWTFTQRLHNLLNYNAGYHLLHHLRPGLHWSRLPREHQADPRYAPAHLVETGVFPGYRLRAGRLRWLAMTRSAPAAE